MKDKYEPCSICECYIEGVKCENEECPVAKMKAEIERLRGDLDKSIGIDNTGSNLFPFD